MRILNELKHCMLPSFYNNVMKILKQMENKEITEAETIEEIKKIYEWKDETIKKMISDYKKRFMNKKEYTQNEIETITKETNIKQWYKENYSSDDLGEEIREDITFFDLFKAIDRHFLPHQILNVFDSVLEDRILDGLDEMLQQPYGTSKEFAYYTFENKEKSEAEILQFLKMLKKEYY